MVTINNKTVVEITNGFEYKKEKINKTSKIIFSFVQM